MGFAVNRSRIVVLLVLLTAGGAFAADAKKRPNILLITTDQQRVGAMSAVGCQWCKTPNMDSIAANGVAFMKSYCPFPLCSPSRSALHAGRTPHEIRVDRNSVRIDPAVPISGQVFQSAGYDTGYAGKWHMPDPYPSDGIAGFRVLNTTSRQGKLAHDVDETTMNAAIGFLKERREKPFYLVVSFINPHDICLLAGEDSALLDQVWKKYQPAEGAKLPPLPPSFKGTDGEPESLTRRGHDGWDEQHWRRYIYAYYRMVEDVDQQVGQVLNALRESGQQQETLIVFTSDHGEGLAARHWTGKMMFYDDEVAVPMIVSWKGVTPGGRIDRQHLVSALDFLPTVCDYAGITPPPKMRGQSLKGLIERPDQPGQEFVASEMAAGALGGSGRSFMIRSSRYKYMMFPAGGRPVEMLFDLESDSNELKNLAGDPKLAAELERHRKLLEGWKKTTEEDQFPVSPNPKTGRKKTKVKTRS